MKKIIAATVLLPVLTQAQDDIVITITGYPTGVDTALTPVSIFQRSDIENSSATELGDLLRQTSGLELGRNGGPGQTASLFFRGTESDHNLVMINGVPINSATVASAALGTLDTQLLERVEVVKGPQSTLWGSSAIGGVINVSTLPSPNSGQQIAASAEYGAHNTLRTSARFSHSESDWQVAMGIARHQTDGIPTLDIATNDSAYHNTAFTLSGSRQFGNFEIKASHWMNQGRSEYQSFTFPAPTFSLVLVPVSQDFSNSASSLSLATQVNDQWQSELQFSLARDHIGQNDSNDFAHTDRYGLNWRNVLNLAGQNKLTLGAEAKWERAAILSFGSSYSGTTSEQAVFAQYDGKQANWNWLAGLRGLNHEDAGQHLTGNLGAGYRLSDSTHIKANFSTGFRYPTATERFVFSPNPNLRPERSRALEVGIVQQFSPRTRVELSAFRTNIRDMIVSTGTFPNTINVNINKAHITGLEAALQHQQGPWKLGASTTLMNPRDDSNNRQLLRRARVSAKASIDYTKDNWQWGSDIIYSGQRPDIDGVTFGNTTTDAYTLVNLNGSFQLNRQWQLFGKVENLFNADYELASRYNTPGRSLFAGIRFNTH